MATAVVGAAVVRHGRVLAARRTGPADLAGRWELPGGKVEADETEPAALERELREELRLTVRIGMLLGRADLGRGRELAIYLCAPAGDPIPGDDHDALRWLTAGELDDVDWLDADRELLPAIRAQLVT